MCQVAELQTATMAMRLSCVSYKSYSFDDLACCPIACSGVGKNSGLAELNLEHPSNQCPTHIFCLSDGDGGHFCWNMSSPAGTPCNQCTGSRSLSCLKTNSIEFTIFFPFQNLRVAFLNLYKVILKRLALFCAKSSQTSTRPCGRTTWHFLKPHLLQ